MSAPPTPALVPPPKRRRPRSGLWQGITRRPSCLLASVKVRTEQRAKSFPLDTNPITIQKWRANTREELSQQAPARGTLAADIERATESLSPNWHLWLRKWAASTLGSKPRARVTREDCEAQLGAWKAEGLAGSSLNHARQALISLWKKLDGKEHHCPARLLDKFDEADPRQGFFEQPALDKVLALLPGYYRDVIEFAAFSGWRRSEVQGLLWPEVDLDGGVIRLSPERSKNNEGRVLPIVGPIQEVIERRLALRDQCPLPNVFWRAVGSRKARKTAVGYLPIGDWRKVWRRACTESGCPDALVHDLRRTVVRNLTRSGVPQKIAMTWTGHKTDSVFRRYDIVNEGDLREAAERLLAHALTKKADGSGK